MGPKRTRVNEVGASSSNPPCIALRPSFDKTRFGYNLNVGEIIRQSFETMVQGATSGGISLVGVITDLCGSYDIKQLGRCWAEYMKGEVTQHQV
uniref:Uncharacterized protein n=1 Tax=Cannabis sativa TaxID=3483 RepID=A0A803NMU7_CANSA